MGAWQARGGHCGRAVGTGGVALIKLPGGFGLLYLTKVGVRFQYFLCNFQPPSEPPPLQFSSDFGITWVIISVLLASCRYIFFIHDF